MGHLRNCEESAADPCTAVDAAVAQCASSASQTTSDAGCVGTAATIRGSKVTGMYDGDVRVLRTFPLDVRHPATGLR
jgi:hypothetical protein